MTTSFYVKKKVAFIYGSSGKHLDESFPKIQKSNAQNSTPSIYLSIYLSVYLSIYLSIYLSRYLPRYLRIQVDLPLYRFDLASKVRESCTTINGHVQICQSFSQGQAATQVSFDLLKASTEGMPVLMPAIVWSSCGPPTAGDCDAMLLALAVHQNAIVRPLPPLSCCSVVRRVVLRGLITDDKASAFRGT